MYTTKDIVSTIFKKFPNKYLSPKFIRDENEKICQQNNLTCGDPGRIARDFESDGFVEKDSSSNYIYNPDKLSNSLQIKWNNYSIIKYNENLIMESQPTLVDNPIERDDYTIDELRKFYAKMSEKDINTDGNKTRIPILFGIKYGKAIIKNHYLPKDICDWSSEISDGVRIYEYLKDNTFNIKFYTPKNTISNEAPFSTTNNLNTSYIKGYSQIIYFGVPGSGKSYKIEKEIKDKYSLNKEDIDKHTMRVVFHPEYTNADFVGQVMPTLNESESGDNVMYKFTPGPFAKILRKAYQNPTEPFCLIIEEINRGNAAAIFGDIFQLLDRLEKGESEDGYTEGWSKYFISNDYLNWYIRENVYEENANDIGIAKQPEQEEEKNHKSITIDNLHFTQNTGIRLPPNLSLYATMNTSDQNVFALDNAFQRRWDMELIPNTCNDKQQMNSTITNKKTQESITWEDFQKVINSFISEKGNESNLSSMEDKRLGCWFVKAKDGKISEDIFKNKVLKYLWDDAFKFCKQDIFKTDIINFEQLQEQYDTVGLKVMPSVYELLSSQGKITSPKESAEQKAQPQQAPETNSEH